MGSSAVLRFVAGVSEDDLMFKRKPNPLLTYLSQKTEFEGILRAEGMLRVDGVIHGTVNIMGDLEISSTGLVEGP
jgi:cytoskeletal protein CcmA (bactofilin family)